MGDLVFIGSHLFISGGNIILGSFLYTSVVKYLTFIEYVQLMVTVNSIFFLFQIKTCGECRQKDIQGVTRSITYPLERRFVPTSELF